MLEYFQRRRGKSIVRAFWVYHLPLYLLRKVRLIGEERFRGPWAAHLTWLARGWTAQQLQELYDWIAHSYVTPLRREDMIARLLEHNAQGHVTVLVSTGFDGLMQAIAQSVGARMAVGTRIKMVNGRCNGQIIKPLVIGAEKDRETRRRLLQNGIEVDFAASHAYADSITDMSLFDMVGHPHAVYPDAELAEVAAQRRWETLGVR